MMEAVPLMWIFAMDRIRSTPRGNHRGSHARSCCPLARDGIDSGVDAGVVHSGSRGVHRQHDNGQLSV